MAVTEDLIVRVGVDAKNAADAIKKLEKSLKGLSKSENDVAKSTDQMASSFSDLKVNVIAVNQGLELAKKAYSTLIGPIKSSISAFIEQDKVQNQLITTLQVLGQNTPANIKDFKDFAKGLSEVTVTSSGTITKLLSLAKIQGLTTTESKALVKASLDLAAATGKDVEGAFKDLRATFRGTSGQLGKVILETENLTEAQLRAGGAVDLVAKKFSGFAESEAKTMAGGLEIQARLWGSIKKSIGGAISEFIDLPGIIQNSVASLRELKKIVKDVIERLRFAKESLASVNWANFAKGAAVATVGVTAFVISLKIAAVKAWISQVIAMAPSLLAAGKAAAFAAARFITIGIVIGGLVIATDFLVANWKNLGDVWTVIANEMQIRILRLDLVVAKVVNSIAQNLLKGVESLNEMGFATDGVVDAFRKMAGETSKSVSTIKNQGKNLTLAQEVAFNNLESGNLVKGFDFIEGMFSQKIPSAIKETGKTSDDTARKIKTNSDEWVKHLEKIKNTLDELAGQNLSLALSIAGINATDIENIQIRLAGELAALGTKRDQLREQNLLTTSVEKQLKLQEALLVEKSSVEIKKMQVELLERQVQLTQGILNDNRDLVSQISMVGATEQDQIQQNMDMDLRRLQIIKDKIIAQKDFTKEVANQLDVQEQLIRLQAKQAKIAVERQQEQKFKEAGEVQLFDMGQVETITSSLGVGAGGMAAAASGMMAAGLGMIGAAGMILDAGTKILGAIPGLFDKATDFINALTDFGPKMEKAIKGFLDAIVRFIKDFIPNMLKSIHQTFKDLINFFVDEVPAAFASLMEELPAILMTVIDELPDMIERFVEGFLSAAPEMISLFINMIAEKGPGIVAAILKMVPKIVIAIAIGIRKALQNIFTGRKFDHFIENITEKFKNGVKALSEQATKEASKVFAVLELDEGGKGLEIAKKAEKQAKEILEKMKGLILWLIERWRALWKWIKEKILEPITNAWRSIWNFVKEFWDAIIFALDEIWALVETIFTTFVTGVNAAWKWFNDEVVTKFASGIQTVWDWFKDNILDKFASGLQTVFDTVKTIFEDFITDFNQAIDDFDTAVNESGGKISDGWKTAMGEMTEFLKGLGGDIALGWKDKMNNLPNTIKNIGGDIALGWKDKMGNLPNTIKDIGGDIALGWKDKMDNLPNTIKNIGGDIALGFRDKFNDLVSGMGKKFAQIFSDNISLPSVGGGGGGGGFSLPTFAEGGVIPGISRFAGNDIRNDTVPVLASPGEVFIPRSVTQDPNMMKIAIALAKGQVSRFQAGGAVMGGPSSSLNLSSAGGLGGSISTVFNQDVRLEMTVDVSAENLDSNFVRDQLIPAVKDALREASNQGELLINEKGVFA